MGKGGRVKDVRKGGLCVGKEDRLRLGKVAGLRLGKGEG